MTHPFPDPALSAPSPARPTASFEREQSRSARSFIPGASPREETVWGPSDRRASALPCPRGERQGSYSRPRFRMGLLVAFALSDGHGAGCLRPRNAASSAALINTGTGGGYT